MNVFGYIKQGKAIDSTSRAPVSNMCVRGEEGTKVWVISIIYTISSQFTRKVSNKTGFLEGQTMWKMKKIDRNF